jgi:hypothetical protein
MENQDVEIDIKKIATVAGGIFRKIQSVKKVYLSDSYSIVTILDNPDRMDRCSLYDAERAISAAFPDLKFCFYSSEGEANYSAYRVIYERI